ncbi:MAG: antibiotic biosynthesis monooxygenase [Burkholderiales bacterium]|nr:antibiotic biosynthesis monooxygenase [Burkholderiales bacterium]
MVVTIFRTHLRSGIDEQALNQLGARMYEIATSMPGFVSYKDFTAADGESLSIVEFESKAALAAWRDHAEHKIAQQPSTARVFVSARYRGGRSGRGAGVR